MIQELIDDVKQLKEQQRHTEYLFQNAITTDTRRRQRVEVQSEDLLGMHLATVVDTIDPLKQGRVRFYTPYLDKEETQSKGLPWASPVSAFGGFDDSGSIWVPPAGSKIVVFFHNGNRDSAFYLGTVWHRSRGPAGEHHETWGYTIKEYDCLWEGKRNGYLLGDGENTGNNVEVLPPWNTEMYNGYDIDSVTDFYNDPSQQNSITYPHIYGFKTNQKHLLKMVDGDPRCNLRHKRLELMSSRGNFLIFKDDHMHKGGEWGFGSGGENCHLQRQIIAYVPGENGRMRPVLEPQSYNDVPLEWPGCDIEEPGYSGDGRHPVVGFPGSCKVRDSSVTSCMPSFKTHFTNQNVGRSDGSVKDMGQGQAGSGSNPFFKRYEEMRPIYGAPTPQNNHLDLPQSGVQLQSISGHQIIMDDSVQEPRGVPSWDRDFEFGCDDRFRGRMYIQSATGHLFEMSDLERKEEGGQKYRGRDNFIAMKSASGNLFELNDETDITAPCDPSQGKAGASRGVTMMSTSTHLFMMNDQGLKQSSPVRRSGGIPKPADEPGFEGFCMLRSGYGMMLLMKDQDIQTETKQQFTALMHPQHGIDYCGGEAGPHMLVMQANAPDPGMVLLRAGGVYFQASLKETVGIVGTEDCPADKATLVTKNYLIDVKETYFNHNNLTVYFSETYIFLLAGRDCPAPDDADAAAEESAASQQESIDAAAANPGSADGSDENKDGPCIYNVIVSKDPWVCPLFGYVHYGVGPGLDSRSERVFASAKKPSGGE